jgi:hypothetical protein
MKRRKEKQSGGGKKERALGAVLGKNFSAAGTGMQTFLLCFFPFCEENFFFFKVGVISFPFFYFIFGN